ncbi:aspartate transaminase [Sphingomonadaceae bacterium OTU29MARTA1]|nr:aspartate transaminase [Sphingomonadaceae bacterium OTU29MARTA1]
MQVSDRVRRIKPSPSTAAADRAAQLRREGRSIVSLVVGEPDFDTPAHVRDAAAAAMNAGATRYTALPGTLELRRAICAKLLRENGVTYDTAEIIVTNGAKSAIYTAFAATIDAGDEVIVPAPYWVSYPDAVLACDGSPISLPCAESQGFKLTPEQLEAAITPRTRWLVLNSPSNPTGATYTPAEYRALAPVLARHPHVMVMTDDIYEHIWFEGETAPHFLSAVPELRDRTLAINGVSKTYAMTGFRIGWAAGPRPLILAMDTLTSQSAGNACSVSQAAATAALEGDQSFVAKSLAVYRKRRDMVEAGICAIPGLSCSTPEGAFYLYVNCAGVIGRTTPKGQVLKDDGDVVLYLLEQVGVAVVAGAAYGLSPYFRLTIATSIEILTDGLTRIAAAVCDLR